MMNKIYAFALLGLVLACAPKVKVTAMQPDPVQVPPTVASPETVAPLSEDLAAGKSLYENRCNKCHGLAAPNEYTVEQWVPILQRMQIKAKIDDAQRESIYRYIVSGLQ